MKTFFPDFPLSFSKKSLIFLTFPDPLTNFLISLTEWKVRELQFPDRRLDGQKDGLKDR